MFRKKCFVYNEDASSFSDIDEYDYFYLYNPFRGKIMVDFINELLESQKRNKRTITVIYSNPTCEKDFLDVGFRRLDIKESLFDKWMLSFMPGVSVLIAE